MSDKKIKIKLEGEGILFEESISKELVPQIIKMCLTPPAETKPATFDDFFGNSNTAKLRESVVEYIRRYDADSNPEKILTFAAFLRNVQNKEVFFQNEIKSLFRDAREIPPANFTRDFNTTISYGWVQKDTEEKDGFYITSTGLKALESGFNGVGSKKAVVRKKNSKSKKK